MKRLVCCLIALLVIFAVPVTSFAAAPPPDETAVPLTRYTYYSDIAKASSKIANISATSGFDSSISLTATAQLQRNVNGTWSNYGTPVIKSATGYSVTASKRVSVEQGYQYRVMGTHSINGMIMTTYSKIMSF